MTETQKVVVYTDVDDTDPSAGIALLEAHGFQVRVLGTRDSAEIVAGAQDAYALLPGYAAVDAETIAQLPNLKLISLLSMGFDYVDVEAATGRGIWVTNVPGAATEEVATHALTLLLANLRQLNFYQSTANPEQWNERAPGAPPRLSELTLGLVGLGRIGQELARQAGAIFGTVLGYDPLLPDTPETRARLAELGVIRTTLDAVQQQSNVLSLHLPLTPDTEHFVDAEFLNGMQPGSLLVNVSRGKLVDSAAVAAALESGHLGGAALDVLDTEPPSAAHPLLGRDDVVLTPHIAYFSARTKLEYVLTQAQNVVALAEQGRPETPLNQV